MIFVYPDIEASKWAEKIFAELVERGHMSVVLAAKERLAQIEEDLEEALSEYIDLYRSGQYEKLLRKMLAEVKGDAKTEETFRTLIRKLKDEDPDAVLQIREIIVLSMLKLGGDGIYKFEYPVDLIVALDALFCQAVAGPIFCQEAKHLMKEACSCEIHFEPFEGDVEVPTDLEEMKAKFRETLKLFAEEFAFSDLLPIAAGFSGSGDQIRREGLEVAEQAQVIDILRSACMEVMAA